MLFSIPLTMLGGWLYLYRGALLTTLLSLAVHYGLFSIHSDQPALETLNPFGIASQLIFSSCTALLKTIQVKYHKLNDSLEEIVVERTKDLDQLTAYLIDAQQLENRELNDRLIEKPFEELKAMLATSQLLKQKLHAEDHPRAIVAENISMIIRDCIKQLCTIDDYSISQIPATGKMTEVISLLRKQISQVSIVDIRYQENPNWETIPENMVPDLCKIMFEAVANALHHAAPKYIFIRLENNELQTSFIIENDGKPLDPDYKEGMGLPLMRYKAGRIGAELSITSTRSNLTRMTCSLPSKS
ncbi:hypothetical protein P4C99_02650 [Pontiellaceae bacterium B1224]|nr:hypothetical protein [Pontiellaceae bacterium B1224]